MLMIILFLIRIHILIFSSTTCNMTVRQFYVGLKIIICRQIRTNFKQLVSKGNNIITDLSFDNTTINCDDSVLLLGVEFDHLLTFNNNIAGICRKSARQLAVLKRLGHLLTLKGKLAIYKLFIECNFNYCPLICHFCSQAKTNKLDKIQERAIRFIYNNYSSSLSDVLKLSGTEYLHVKMLKLMACEVYKIVNDLSPSFISDLIEIKHSQYSMRRINSAFIPKAHTNKY